MNYTVNEDNVMVIDGVDVRELVKEFNTPLYVYNQSYIENQINTFKRSFQHDLLDTRVIYASKAFLSVAMIQLINKMGLSIDAVSGGELFMIHHAGFRMENVFFHGNNKTEEELLMALDYGVGYIVVDNVNELEVLCRLTEERAQSVNTLFRVNPGIEAHTHEYIQTATMSSKFGVYFEDEESLTKVFDTFKGSKYVNLLGFHCHIGSQIFVKDSFVKAVEAMIRFVSVAEKKYELSLSKLNIGGGFGVVYTKEDDELDLDDTLKTLVDVGYKLVKEYDLKIDELMIEPGRSIVNNAGITLYTVGGIKNTMGSEDYIFIDGGMTDNIRPALYQAKYEPFIATKMNLEKDDCRTVAGKCCESGDIICRNAMIQKAEKGDILAVVATGAYNYSMSSNYNNALKPAVVFVKDGESKLVVKRQSYADLIMNDKGLM